MRKKIEDVNRKLCRAYQNKPLFGVLLVKKVYQIRGRRTGRKQEGLHKETTPTNVGWKA